MAPGPRLAALLALPLVGAEPLFRRSVHVAELLPSDFPEAVLGGNRSWVVDFYADWCPHCIHFAPVWDEVAGAFQAEAKLAFGAVNCGQHAEFCAELGVSSFPTLRAFRFPGQERSFGRKGSELHEGEYREAEAGVLVALLRLELARLEGVAAAYNRTEGKYCSQSSVSVLRSFPFSAGNSSGARAACEHFCLGRSGCQACSTRCGAGCSWQALPACGLLLDALGFEGGVSTKIPLPLRPGGEQMPILAPAPAPRDPGAGLAPARQRWHDAEVALRYSLRQGPHLAAGGEHGTLLSGEALAELGSWLGFLARVLPSGRARRRLRALQDLVAESVAGAKGLEMAEWVGALEAEVFDSVPVLAGREPAGHWRLCRGYTCGLWTLLHLAAVGARELSEQGREAPNGPEVLLRIRGFVATFFGCADCARHFVESYERCDFGRCSLTENDQGIGASLWLWRAHNAVAARVAAEANGTVTPWPLRRRCSACWPQHGQVGWDEAAVYGYLVRAYWPLRSEYSSPRRKPPSLPMPTSSLLFLAVVLLAASGPTLWLCQRSRSARDACHSGHGGPSGKEPAFLADCEDESSEEEALS